MKERGPWRVWSTFLLIIAGNLCNSVVQSQSYDSGSRGDTGDGSVQSLGFDGIVTRHDGYVKGETPTIPQTSFTCSAQPYNPGLYADVETQCQVYHVCFEDRQESFLCGPGTNFNQRILACDFWYNFDCQDSPNFYSVNADIGKVPQTVFNPGQSREPAPSQPRPQPPSRPSYPSFPQQPAQPPSVGSYPPHVSVPPPPPPRPVQPQPQPPRITPQPQPPAFRPEPPRVQPEPPRVYPQPQPPAFRPEPPRVQPEPPREYPQPQPPAFRPEPPRVQPEPPREYPQHPAPPSRPQTPRPQPPAFRPQPRPDPPHVSVQPQYPRVPQGSGHGEPSKVRPPPPTQQEEDGYHFDGYQPPRPVALPPPPPPRTQPPRPVFPPVVSPPRVSRPPLTPSIIRQPEISRPRPPTIDVRSEFHPDANLKGNVGYQPPRVPQPSRPVSSDYPSYPVAQRPAPVAQRPAPVVQRPAPVAQRPAPVAQRPAPVAQRPAPVAQRPAPVAQRPVEKPSRPAYRPPATVQQEHVDTEYVPPPPPPPREPSRPQTTYVPPPPPPPPREPSRPQTTYVPPPPPPRPVQQEVTNVGFTKPPQPSRPAYVPPPVAQKPVDKDYGKQPPVAPSVIREQQKPASPPPSRPQVSTGSRQPSRPKPVFPPASDHPNSNIKGGPGYNQPPPQIPRFEPTRIGRPSSPQGGYQAPPQAPRPRPPVTQTAVKPTVVKTPTASGQAGYKPDRVKKPSDPPRTVYQPPIQVIDHPRADIKGIAYDPPRQPQRQPPRQPPRVQAPSSPVSGVKRPQTQISDDYNKPQVQRPRAPVVVARPQPPSLPTTSVKKTTPVVVSQVYEKPKPQAPAPARVKQPSVHVQTVSRPSQPRFPSYEDHPNANVKGGCSGYNQPCSQPVGVSRPSGPPISPSTSYEQKTTSSNQGRGSGSGYPSPPSYPPRGDGGSVQVIHQEDYKPSRSSPPSSVKTVQKITAVKDTGSYQRPPSSSQHSVLINKQSKPDYEAGSSYNRGPETYPKPEFGKPHTPVSTPSRVIQTTKQGSPSQNTITRSQNKPAYQEPSVSAGSGSGSDVRPDYPFNRVPGHQPPHERQVFPHRENPDHPNESLKGSGAYRPPPPAGFQASASEVQEQKAVPEPEPEPASSSLHGDTGSE